MTVFTDNPVYSTAKQLARTVLNNGRGTVAFDVAKGTEQVFVSIQKNGKSLVYGYSDIVDGKVDAATVTARHTAVTRAEESCPVTKGDTKQVELKFEANDGSDKNVELTMLNGVEKKSVDQPWTLSWGYELFGPGAFFEEYVKYFKPKKQQIPGYDLNKVEQGFSIVSNGGEISLSLVFGVGTNANRMGYIYYKDGQDPLTQPHYILMEDARPEKNIYIDSWGGRAVGNMELTDLCNNGKQSGKQVYGTKYKLAFFGENHDEPATYNFPKGYNIVFFIAPRYSVEFDYALEFFNYSLPDLNRRIGHLEKAVDADACDGRVDPNPNYDPARGAIKAAAWKYNSITFLGFEDLGGEQGDEDLNDLVFWVEGEYRTPEEVIEVPSTTVTTEKINSWILACEDLGSTNDYDFNDIVLEVVRVDEIDQEYKEDVPVGAPVYKGSKLKARCLAAGGTLPAYIYYDGELIGESHEMLGGDTNQMINTMSFKGASEWKELSLSVGYDWTLTGNVGKFKIVVQQKTGETGMENIMITAPEKTGIAPQMIILPGDWQWPVERINIEEAYPEFGKWSGNASFIGWNDTMVKTKVVTH